VFDPLRPKLTRIGYRMVGPVCAEDVAENARLPRSDTDRDAVIVTHLCLEYLKSARYHHEAHIEPWLAEPVIEPEDDEIDDVTSR
jgi:RNA polymerase sigma-70 factor (ECF subfamily)